MDKNKLRKQVTFAPETKENCRVKGDGHLITSNFTKSNIRKKLIRNAEEPVFIHVRNKTTVSPIKTLKTETFTRLKPDVNLSRPELHSCLKIARKLHSTATNSNGFKCLDKESYSLRDRSRTKLNVPLEASIYKDLIAISVPEEDLFEFSSKIISKDSEYFQRPKDREPKLEDFFIPSFRQEYIDVPKLTVEPLGRVQMKSVTKLYEKLQLWDKDYT